MHEEQGMNKSDGSIGDKLVIAAAVVAILAVMILAWEGGSSGPHYELRPATVMKVVPDARGFLGADQMTIVKFEDGYVTEVPGDRGVSGDKIMADRQLGTSSMFGWLGDISHKEAKRKKVALWEKI